MKKAFVAILLVIAALITMRDFGCFSETSKETLEQIKARVEAEVQAEVKKPKHNKLGAFTIAQDFIGSRLKCPRTAKWPWVSYSKVTVHLGNGRYRISSYLDAQNGFGALVRIHFICVVEHISGDRWRLIKLIM